MVESMIKDMIDRQENPTIATYAKTGEVHIRVTAEADSEKHALKMMKPVVHELKKRFQENIYTTNEEVTLEQACVDLLLANELTISTMESALNAAPDIDQTYGLFLRPPVRSGNARNR